MHNRRLRLVETEALVSSLINTSQWEQTMSKQNVLLLISVDIKVPKLSRNDLSRIQGYDPHASRLYAPHPRWPAVLFLVVMRAGGVRGGGCPDLCGWSALPPMSLRSHCHLMNVLGCGIGVTK